VSVPEQNLPGLGVLRGGRRRHRGPGAGGRPVVCARLYQKVEAGILRPIIVFELNCVKGRFCDTRRSFPENV